jgi:hypothetical protein
MLSLLILTEICSQKHKLYCMFSLEIALSMHFTRVQVSLKKWHRAEYGWVSLFSYFQVSFIYFHFFVVYSEILSQCQETASVMYLDVSLGMKAMFHLQRSD